MKERTLNRKTNSEKTAVQTHSQWYRSQKKKKKISWNRRIPFFGKCFVAAISTAKSN
jgi:hypothetical protein